jgi:putative ABC transport system permease protein
VPTILAALKDLGVHVNQWLDARDEIARQMARAERVGILGVLTFGFLGAAALSAIGFLVYNYASLQERLFRFTVLRAVGFSLRQLIGQLGVESLALMTYSVVGGVGIGALASCLFIPFFQAADAGVLNPPPLLPLVAWDSSARISAAFAVTLLVAQMAVVMAAVGKGVFQALRMGDRE